MRRRFTPIDISTNNVIRYTTSDGSIVSLYRVNFGATMVENSYGVLSFNSNVLYIGDMVFAHCSNLTSIEIPNSVTSIGDGAFAYCSSLTSIEIPNSVTSIGASVFYDCENLTSVEIGNSVTSIGGSMFYYCSSLTSIEIPNSVTSIGGSAFQSCSSLTSIEIPNSVTSIERMAFIHCTRLSSVYIKPTTPPTLGTDAFLSNTSNRKIYVPRASVDAYKTASGWSGYADSIEPYDY